MKLSVALLLLSLTLTALGGYMDLFGVQRFFGISRNHAWNDGLYTAVLALAVHTILRA